MPCLPIFSPTVSTTRRQPTMVPMPSASATATMTHSGAYSVVVVRSPRNRCKSARSRAGRPSSRATFLAVSSRHSR
ncbi:Uncharacterised protein [Bordetella pertussis]|nr:Uncharacterised protein [Bordetella pertussis]CFW16680.1 Uncharacterised protein [Bordetella pertussis]